MISRVQGAAIEGDIQNRRKAAAVTGDDSAQAHRIAQIVSTQHDGRHSRKGRTTPVDVSAGATTAAEGTASGAAATVATCNPLAALLGADTRAAATAAAPATEC